MNNKKIDAMIEKTVLKMPINDFCKAMVFRLAKDETIRDHELILVINVFQVLGYLNEPYYTDKVFETIKSWDGYGDLDALLSDLHHSVMIDLQNGGFDVIS